MIRTADHGSSMVADKDMSQRRRDIALRRRCDGSDGAAMAFPRRSDSAPMALRWRWDGAPISARWRCNVAPMYNMRMCMRIKMSTGHALHGMRIAIFDNEITWDHFMESYPWTRQCMSVNVLLAIPPACGLILCGRPIDNP